MCHEMNGVAPKSTGGFSLLRRILSSHHLDNASRDNAGETLCALDIDHNTFVHICIFEAFVIAFFFSYPAEVSYYSIFPFSVPYVWSTITRDFLGPPRRDEIYIQIIMGQDHKVKRSRSLIISKNNSIIFQWWDR